MTTITVSSLQGLYSALAKAKGGETIALAGGDYGKMLLAAKSGFDITFPSNVTITSANPNNPAVFSGIDIRGAANLTFDGMVFDYTFAPGDKIYSRPFSVSGGENITIRNSTFDGDVARGVSSVDDGYGFAIGLSVRGTSNVIIDGNEFSNFHRGMSITESRNITVTDNDLHSLRSDGMNFAEVTKVRIEGNYIHDFRGSPTSADHCDMIQFWTNGTDSPSTNILIRGNVLDIGNGTATQSIFMRNDQVDLGLAGPEMFYRNVTIEQNVITNGHLHGIAVGETAGLIIRQNSVLHADGGAADGTDDSVEIPQISVADTSTGVAIIGNVTSAIAGVAGQADWTIRQNAFVQDQNPLRPGYYGDVFVASSLASPDGINSFVALPGGMIDRLGAGASVAPAQPSAVTALFHVTDGPENALQTRVFDGQLSSLGNGTLPEGTVYQWSFGDGTVALGRKVNHTFPDGGEYAVTLTVRLPDGRTDSEKAIVAVQDNTILSMNAKGVFTAYENGAAIGLPASVQASADGLQLGGPGVAARVAREHVSDLLGPQDFSISFRLDADKAGTSGEIFRIHESLLVNVNTAGELAVQGFAADGSTVRLIGTGVKVNDRAPHDIDIRLDDGRLQLVVDGKVRADTAFDGQLADKGTHDLTFGNPWGSQNFAGDLSRFEIRMGDAAPVLSTAPESIAAPAKSADNSGLILSMTPAGIFTAHENGTAIALKASSQASVDGIQLGGPGVAASVAREHARDILDADEFSISMRLDADKAGTSGEVFRIHESLLMTVDTAGQLVLQAWGDTGSMVKLTTAGAKITDLAAHDIDIRLDDGRLQLLVDGKLRADAAFDGQLQDKGRHDLTFGNAWGKQNFNGDLTEFDIRIGDPTPHSAPAHWDSGLL